MREYISGTSSSEIEKHFSKTTHDKLDYHEDLAYDMTDGQLTFLDLLNQGACQGTSVSATARQLGYTGMTLAKVYRGAGIPILSQPEAARAVWRDPRFRDRHAEASRESLKILKLDPEFRQRQAAAMHAKWQDSAFRQRNTDAVRAKWQDPEFRKRHAEAARIARLSEEKQGRYHLPTIQGIRKDVGYASSAYEANIARVLTFIGRDYVPHQPLRLGDGSIYDVDFVTASTTPSGETRFILYEIMAHPKEDPEGWDKLDKAKEEYPEYLIVPITEKFYRKLERRFKQAINNSSSFCGWETKKDNLRHNPAKYAQKVLYRNKEED